jgi:HKD family nuclease
MPVSLQKDIEIFGGKPNGGLLKGIRSVFDDATESILCVAFINRAGVALIENELQKLGPSARVLLTSVFGSTTQPALHTLQRLGCRVKILNLSGGTYHPKLYLAGARRFSTAAIGSANLTSGLIKNVEVMSRFRGDPDWKPIRESATIAEDLWNHPSALPSRDVVAESKDEVFSPELESLIRRTFHLGQTIKTISQGQSNRIMEILPSGILIETGRTESRGTGPQLVDAWMIELAWDSLKSCGELSNTTLLNELKVHRSSAVCALLAHLEGVCVVSTRPIILSYNQAKDDSLER